MDNQKLFVIYDSTKIATKVVNKNALVNYFDYNAYDVMNALHNLQQNKVTITNLPHIKIFGIGGAGCNIVKSIRQKSNFIRTNTLSYCFDSSENKTNNFQDVNFYLLDDNKFENNDDHNKKIKNILQNTKILFLIGGLGKKTGTNGLIKIAQIAKELNILTICFVNMPSISWEGVDLYSMASNAIDQLKNEKIAIITFSNEKIVQDDKIGIYQAYDLINYNISKTIEEVTHFALQTNNMNIPFANICNYLQHNTFFAIDKVDIDNNDLSYEKIANNFLTSFKQSKSNLDFTSIKDILIIAKINKYTPGKLFVLIRKFFVLLTKNQNLKINFINEKINNSSQNSILYILPGNLRMSFQSNEDLFDKTINFLNCKQKDIYNTNDKDSKISFWNDWSNFFEKTLATIKTRAIKQWQSNSQVNNQNDEIG